MSKYSDNELVSAAFQDAVKSTGNWYRMRCPLCLVRTGSPDTGIALGILAGSWRYHCFRCHATGQLKNPPGDVVLMDAAEAAVEEQREMALPDGYTPLWEEPGLSAVMFEPARKLLYKRNVKKSIWAQAQIGAAIKGYAAYRVVVPVIFAGECFGWIGRSWCNVDLRYIYPKGMRRGDLLFNEEALFRDTDEPVLVVEGIFDALPHWPNAVACLGKPTSRHVDLIIQSQRRIVVVLDGDAWQEGEALSIQLQLAGKDAYFLRLPPLKDPGDYDYVGLSRLVNEVIR